MPTTTSQYQKDICIDLWNFIKGDIEPDFNMRLFRLIASAALLNYAKIKEGWPDVVAVWERWHDHEDGMDWLEREIKSQN